MTQLCTQYMASIRKGSVNVSFFPFLSSLTLNLSGLWWTPHMVWIQAFQPLSSDAGWRAASLTAEMPSSTTGKTNPQRTGAQTPQYLALLYCVSYKEWCLEQGWGCSVVSIDGVVESYLQGHSWLSVPGRSAGEGRAGWVSEGGLGQFPPLCLCALLLVLVPGHAELGPRLTPADPSLWNGEWPQWGSQSDLGDVLYKQGPPRQILPSWHFCFPLPDKAIMKNVIGVKYNLVINASKRWKHAYRL